MSDATTKPDICALMEQLAGLEDNAGRTREALRRAAAEIRRLRAALAVIAADTPADEPAHQVAADAIDGATIERDSDLDPWIDACQAILRGQAPDRDACPSILWTVWERMGAGQEANRSIEWQLLRTASEKVTNLDHRCGLLAEVVHSITCGRNGD